MLRLLFFLSLSWDLLLPPLEFSQGSGAVGVSVWRGYWWG